MLGRAVTANHSPVPGRHPRPRQSRFRSPDLYLVVSMNMSVYLALALSLSLFRHIPCMVKVHHADNGLKTLRAHCRCCEAARKLSCYHRVTLMIRRLLSMYMRTPNARAPARKREQRSQTSGGVQDRTVSRNPTIRVKYVMCNTSCLASKYSGSCSYTLYYHVQYCRGSSDKGGNTKSIFRNVAVT